MVWLLGTTNRISVIAALAAVAIVQILGVVAMWSGEVSGRAYAVLSALLVLSAAVVCYLAVANTAGIDGGGAMVLLGGLLVGLLLQLNLVHKAAAK
ncbi:hypothetical protein ACFWUP_27425 [Nocardia sp. NPDC058658]|uniref:hypothetical protein n=1 Tax=Nocardia sp. NPDC058658 TaxID=3346580 RepID=UPI0036693F79